MKVLPLCVSLAIASVHPLAFPPQTDPPVGLDSQDGSRRKGDEKETLFGGRDRQQAS